MFGFLNIYKPEGMTSFDVVAFLRECTLIKQIGHTGTLDPLATGVLPICIGKATKLIEYLPDDKRYVATVKLGCDTDTYDSEGEVTKIYNNIVTKDDLENIFHYFIGEIEQYPPIYSAIKVKGKKLYEYARKGEKIDIKSRKVLIKNIKLLNFDYSNQIAKISVECSKGTYIRSIAYDIGQKLNCGAHLIGLERTSAGIFEVNNSVTLDKIKSRKDVEKYIINPSNIFYRNIYNITEEEKNKVIHGMSFMNRNIQENTPFETLSNGIVFLVYNDKMYGIGYLEDNFIKIKKVFEVT